MKAQWLIELGLFTDTEDRLIDAIKRSGREYKTLKYIPFDEDLIDRCNKLYHPDDCVIFYGSLNFGRKIMRGTKWVPGIYLKEKEYECTSYYPAFGINLLHNQYIMLPYGELIRMKHHIFWDGTWYNGTHNVDKVFIRPNSGYKQFTGMVLDSDSYEEGVKLAGFYDVEPNLLCVASYAKDIKKEWRFVIVNQEAICGSLYRDWTIGPDTIIPGTTTRDLVLMNSKSVTEPCTDDKAFAFANEMAKLYNPDTCWTIDIALTSEDRYKVIEIGCFSCAGMYGNDLDIIVNKVSEAAEKEWNEYNEA